MSEDHGIQLINERGQVFFDTNYSTWNFLGHFIAEPDTTTTENFPTLNLVDEIVVHRSFVDAPPGDQEAIVHDVAYSAATGEVVASGGKVRTAVLILGR